MKSITTSMLLFLSVLVSAQEAFFPRYEEASNNWVFVDENGEQSVVVKEKKIADIMPLFDDRALALDSVSNKWGYLNSKGKWAIKPNFSTAHSFVEGYAIVQEDCIECLENAYGLMFPWITKVIDKKGKVILKDYSQAPEQFFRWSFEKHLKGGVFLVVKGVGLGDTYSLVNIKGELMVPDFSSMGGGETAYCADVDAYKCGALFYDEKGNIKSDYSDYGYIRSYRNGYAWMDKYVETEEGDYSNYKVLMDTKGKVVFEKDGDDCDDMTDVKEGKFLYTNGEGKRMSYDIISTVEVEFEGKELELPLFEELVYNAQVDLDLIVDYDNGAPLVLGFVTKKNQVFYKW